MHNTLHCIIKTTHPNFMGDVIVNVLASVKCVSDASSEGTQH